MHKNSESKVIKNINLLGQTFKPNDLLETNFFK